MKLPQILDLSEFYIGVRVASAGLLVCIACSCQTSQSVAVSDVPFTLVTIDPAPPERPWYKMLGDVDGDRQPDVVIAGSKGPMFWYRYPDWQKFLVAASANWNGVRGALGDVDGDGDNDIVMGGAVWYVNPSGEDRPWAQNPIDSIRLHDVELVDLDRDGLPDMAGRDQSAFGKKGDSVYVYLQRPMNNWEKQSLPCPHGEGLQTADLDGDGDTDLIIGGRWYENDGRGAGWQWHGFSTSWTEDDAKVETADLNNDGRPDIILTPAELKGERSKVAWYEAPADPKQAEWTEHVVVPDIECVIHALAVGDFNNDGQTDFAMAEMHQGEDPDDVSLFLNLSGGAVWKQQVLAVTGSHDLAADDVGGDGDLDLLGANHAGDHQAVELWENKLIP